MLKTIIFEVIGDRRLACAGCEERVQRLLGEVPGVRQVRASAQTQRIELLCEPSLAEPATITHRLVQAGYAVRSEQDQSDKTGVDPGHDSKVYGEVMKAKTNKSGWLGGVVSVLASVLALVCPVCIASSLGLVASLGSGLAAGERFIQPVLIGLLALAIAAFAWSARLHRRWWIVVTGIAGAVLVYLGRYYLGFSALWMNRAASWTGTGLLVGTALVNLWLKRSCSSCAKSSTQSEADTGACCSAQSKT